MKPLSRSLRTITCRCWVWAIGRLNSQALTTARFKVRAGRPSRSTTPSEPYALLGAVLAMLALHDLGRNHLGESAWSPLSKLLMRLLAGSISVWGPNL